MKLYNTMTRSVDAINPQQPGRIRLYTCGLTVYSQPQIGNWVAYIYSDVLTRTLISSGFEVERTQNITDVGHLVSDDDDGEDKMQKGARQEGMDAWGVAKKYSQIASQEAKKLGLLPPNHLVPATSLIDQQIEFASQLEAKGYLYKTSDGMYFDTAKISDYGKLARLDIAGLEAGARVEMAEKKNPTDFAVWKFSEPGKSRDMEWDSPWGIGFPGWHLECSVIARQTLGDQIDIHTGGIDHIPVHHSNEIAQSEALTGKTFVRHWFHNNHIKVAGAKLSKSLGNSYTLSDIEQHGYDLDAFKLLVLSSHYRTEGNFSWEILDAAQARLGNWRASAARRWQIHDSLQQTSPLKQGIVSEEDYSLLEDYTYRLFERGTELAEAQGLILVDTKYEFGKTKEGEIVLIDEIHTPDSSRYFYAEGYPDRLANGEPQKQLSKEFVRQWLMQNGFQGKEGQQIPEMSDAYINSVSERYIELYEQITGEQFIKADISNIEERIERNVFSYLKV